MASAHDRRQSADYRLDIAIRDGLLVLNVRGTEGPQLRRHVAEVERAAERCGLRVAVVQQDGSPSRPRR